MSTAKGKPKIATKDMPDAIGAICAADGPIPGAVSATTKRRAIS